MSRPNSARYPYIAVEGNIGAGKTTLAGLLARDQDRRLILEQFDDNPFLHYFYRDPERYALPVELFFLTERFKQWESEQEGDLFRTGMVSDYTFTKTLLFARNNLEGEEFRLFNRVFSLLQAQVPPPDIILFLHRPIAWLKESIARRGRVAEAPITDSYLEQIQEAYLNWFRQESERPVILLELKELDFVKYPEVYHRIVALLNESYPPGLTRLTLH